MLFTVHISWEREEPSKSGPIQGLQELFCYFFFSLLEPAELPCRMEGVLISEESATQHPFISPIRNLGGSFALKNFHIGHGT